MTQISEGHGVPHAYAIDPHKNPSTANHEDLDRLSPGYQSFEHPHLHGAEFTFHPNFELSKLDHYPAAPGQFDDDSDEDDIHDQADLQDRIRERPEHTHPLVVVQHPDRHELLDGSHRAGLALDAGVTHLPAYVHEPPHIATRGSSQAMPCHAQSSHAQPRRGRKDTMADLPHERLFGRTWGLDKRLFHDDKLKDSIREDIITRFRAFCFSHGYSGWPVWAKIIFFGSEASTWTSKDLVGNNDFDLSIGLQYDDFRTQNPLYAEVDDATIANMWTAQLHAELNDPEHQYPGIEGSYDQTWYCNSQGWMIQKMRPYAAYDVVTNEWVVKPPDLPDWDITKFPEGKGLVEEIRGIIEMARGILKMPEPYRTQNGAALWHYVHDNRADAFGPIGEGWLDPRNVVEKGLDQKGLMQPLWACMERAKNNPETLLAPPDWSNDPTTMKGYHHAHLQFRRGTST